MAQILGYLAMIITILSYQAKTQKNIVTIQIFSTLTFTIHFILLEAYSGAILNLIGTIRAIIFSQRDKKWGAHYVWVIIFILLTFLSYFLTVFIIIPEPTVKTYLVELLPTLGFIATTFSLRMNNAKLVRRYSLLNSPLWLTYDIINGSWGGAITETFSIVSILIAMFRLDFKKKG